MEKEEIELASDKSASDIEITVEELLDFGIDVDQGYRQDSFAN